MKQTVFSESMISEFKAKGFWKDSPMYLEKDITAANFPNKVAIVDPRRTLTWAEVKKYSDRIALGLLELGLKRDEVVLFHLPNCTEVSLMQSATEKAGLIGLHCPAALRRKEMAFMLKASEASAVVIPTNFNKFNHLDMINQLKPELPNLRHIIVIDDPADNVIRLWDMANTPLEKKYPADYFKQTAVPVGEIILLMFTSGSTGIPKLVTHGAPTFHIVGHETVKRGKITPDDTVVALATLAGGASLAGAVLAPTVTGCKSVMLEKWDVKEAFRLIQQEKATIITAVPTQLIAMANHPSVNQYDLSSLRLALWAGALLPPDAAAHIEATMGCRTLGYYGAIENSYMSMALIDDPAEIRHFTVGKLYPGLEGKIVDNDGNEMPRGEIGEVWIRGAAGGMGIYKDPERTLESWTKDAWYKTGDLGVFDQQGNLKLVGRKKDLIIRGGQNIFPAEIENLILQNPKIANAVVVAIPDKLYGERACVCVVLQEGETFSFDEMVAFFKEKQTAMYKIPEYMKVLDQLPMLPGNKVDKIQVTKMAAEEFENK